MKKKSIICTLALCLICLFVCACGSEKAKKNYYDNEELVKADSYSKVGSVYNQKKNGFVFTCSKFNGFQTMLTIKCDSEETALLNVLLSMKKGTAKLVLTDDDDNVTDLYEWDGESFAGDRASITLNLKEGRNRIKFVGYDCEGIELDGGYSLSSGK